MSKKKLFDEDSDEDVQLKTENEYAKKYDTWREKEELHKLEQKYGDNPIEADASSDSDTESEELEVSEETETQFLKTLALLKTKDPRIYDPQFKCFEEKESKDEVEKPKPKTLTFEDSDDDDDGPIFTIEKKAQVDDQSAIKNKTDTTGKKSRPKLTQYLTGEMEEEVDEDLAPLRALWSDPKLSEGEAFLRDYILNKRYLAGGTPDTAEDKLRDDEDLEKDEQRVEEQGQFERAYNFRFEEPDHEFLKRFPRTVSSIRPKDERRSKRRVELRTRKADDKQRKMDEIARMKAFKLKEIQEKIAKIKEVTGNEDLAFKDEDIEGDFDPLEHDRRMQAIFNEQYYQDADGEKPVFPDLDEELEIENWDNYDPEPDREEAKQSMDGPHCEDDDFNMDADYDPKQQRATLLEEIQKTLGKKRRNRKNKSKLAQLLSSEKPKFIPTDTKTYDQYMEEYYKMDCEDIIGGDLPTRFKYREVVPNDYGLSIEEILLADDKELTQWVPLKRLVRHRPFAAEKGEVNTYARRGGDVALKRRMLPSLFKDLPKEPELVVPVEEATKKKKKKKKNRNKNKEEEPEPLEQNNEEKNHEESVKNEVDTPGDITKNSDVHKKKKKRKNKDNVDNLQDIQLDDSSNNNNKNTHNEIVLENNVDTNTKLKTKKENRNKEDIHMNKKQNENVVEVGKKEKEVNKNKKHNSNITRNSTMTSNDTGLISTQTKQNNPIVNPKGNKKKHKKEAFTVETIQNEGPSQSAFTKETQVNNLKRKTNTKIVHVAKKYKLDHKEKGFKNKFNKNTEVKRKSKNLTDNDNPLSKISDERLKAYGLNPKKYRSFLKYKKF